MILGQLPKWLNRNWSHALLCSVAAAVNHVPLAVSNTRESFPKSRNTYPIKRGQVTNISEEKNLKKKNMNKSMYSDVLQELDTHQGKQLSCPVCGKTFFQKSDVKRHLVVHTGEKFSCSYCPKQFSQKYTRNLHEKTHIAELMNPGLSDNL